MGPDAHGWNEPMIMGSWNSNTTIETNKGALFLKLLEPGVVLQKIVVDMGGLRSNGLGPPESRRIDGSPDIPGILIGEENIPPRYQVSIPPF